MGTRARLLTIMCATSQPPTLRSRVWSHLMSSDTILSQKLVMYP